jgi:hypothetical protein
VNSTCSASNGGALATNGNSANLTLNNGALIRLAGDYVPGPLTITPSPLTQQPIVNDPLANALQAMPTLTTISNNKVTIGSDTVLSPGVYVGGIKMKNQAKAYLQPGIYVMQGGGFDIGAQNGVYSVVAGATSTTDATWATDCPAATAAGGTCGVLLYNTSGSGNNTMGQVTVGAGATMKLRPYQPTADATGPKINDYLNLLIWQDASPIPTISTPQPVIQLGGGGSVDLSGTIYAPSGQVSMGGGAGGAGGTTDVTVQFISWDLTLSGNSSFIFRYRSDAFARPTDYGLIK